MALVEGCTGDAPSGPAAATAESHGANAPVDPAGAAAGAAPAAAASQGASQAGSLAVKPQAFKHLVGRGHPEFSSSRQQVRQRRIMGGRCIAARRPYHHKLTMCSARQLLATVMFKRI